MRKWSQQTNYTALRRYLDRRLALPDIVLITYPRKFLIFVNFRIQIILELVLQMLFFKFVYGLYEYVQHTKIYLIIAYIASPATLPVSLLVTIFENTYVIFYVICIKVSVVNLEIIKDMNSSKPMIIYYEKSV